MSAGSDSPRPTRQAVVIVHGIGQQRPGSTLSDYVKNLVGDDDQLFASPDRVSAQADLRRMKVTWLPELDGDEDSPQAPVVTDFYEMYWANLVVGSQLKHVTSWLFSMLPRWRQIGPRMRSFLSYHFVYALVLGLLVAAAVAFTIAFFDAARDYKSEIRIVGSLVLTSVAGWLVWHLGDVPRYLYNVADNVSIQRAVRAQGLALLEQLHSLGYTGSNRPMYDRVVVAGHSLGSVVAYDMVRDYWAQVNRFYGTTPTSPDILRKAADQVDLKGEALWAEQSRQRRGTKKPQALDATDYQKAQRPLSAQLEQLTSMPPGETTAPRWAITDLVTLACPLTHAEILLAAGPAALAEAQWSRSLASCPPRRQTGRPSYRFGYVRGRTDLQSWHHAAPFALTRWTNVFFESDPVGGPLQPNFGPGINDIRLRAPKGLRGRMPTVHTIYDEEQAALDELRRVVWDGASRRPVESLTPRKIDTLRQLLGPMLLLNPEERADALATAPTLRRLKTASRQTLREHLDAAVVEPHPLACLEARLSDLEPELLAEVRVADRGPGGGAAP